MERIDHIVVVMMENRSFDSLLGKLYPKSEAFDGLSDEDPVWNDPKGGIHPIRDPDDSFDATTEQLLGVGFAASYQKIDPKRPYDVLHYYTPNQVPVLSYLAKQYAVSDAWFSSVPGPTQPNRMFLHGGTSDGITAIYPPLPLKIPTIFSRFEDWKIYFSSFPLAALLADTWQNLNNFDHFGKFKRHAMEGTLPAYSFIEPSYMWNCQHPPSPIGLGEAFYADIYNTLRSSPKWEKTLLVITYDEHGGLYDHVLPPPAIPPESPKPNTFAFDRYGVRVPAVVVSPWIKPGTIFRAPAGAQPYDHTSILKTIRNRFKLGKAFSAREASAPDLSPLLTLKKPTNLGEPIQSLKVPLKDTLASPKGMLLEIIYNAKNYLPKEIIERIRRT